MTIDAGTAAAALGGLAGALGLDAARSAFGILTW